MEHRPKLFYQRWFRGKACFMCSKLASLRGNLFKLTIVGSYSWVKSLNLSRVKSTVNLSEQGLEPCLQKLVSSLFPWQVSPSDFPLFCPQRSQRHFERLQLFFMSTWNKIIQTLKIFAQWNCCFLASPIMESYAPMTKREKNVSLSRLQNVKCCY